MKAEVKEFLNENYKDGKIYDYKKIINHAEYLISAFEKRSSTEKILLYDLCFGEERGKVRHTSQAGLRQSIKLSKNALNKGQFTKSMFIVIFLLKSILKEK